MHELFGHGLLEERIIGIVNGPHITDQVLARHQTVLPNRHPRICSI